MLIIRIAWHSGQTCEEYDLERRVRMEQEAASANIIVSTAKICPNCGYAITKNGGCDHMTCTNTLLWLNCFANARIIMF
jgi:hypothetical protein